MLKSKLQTCLSKWLCIGVCFLIVSCTLLGETKNKSFVDPVKYPELVDQSWLVNDENCSAPCWLGLVPGISSQAEALALAKTLSFVESGKELDNATGNFMFPCKIPTGSNCLAMRFENGTLSSLRLYPNYQITFEQVVNKIGPPDSFRFLRRNPEGNGCSVYVYWIDLQLEIGYGDPSSSFGEDSCELIDKNNGKFPKGILVEDVHYMTSMKTKEVIEIVQQPETGQNYTLWSGFAE
jgi:hypothetical protein